jgi:L-histidine N-alpha-methyltransferase
MTPAPLTIAVHTFGQDARDDLIADVRAGLTATPKSLPPRWFYDQRGSELFEAITRLPEYYLTRVEASILEWAAPDVISAVRPQALVELGAGSSEKTRSLIAAGRRHGLTSFLPFDISEDFLQRTARQVAAEFPGLSVYAVVGAFADHQDRVPRHGRQLIAFLGSTIGNFDDAERRAFLDGVRRLLQPGDAFLLGLDLVKPEAQLVAAYDDPAGVTAEFNRNLLHVLNRELGADFDVAGFEHVAVFNRERSRIEMHLRARRRQHVRIPGAGLSVDFDPGELLLTEISIKFTREGIERDLDRSGMRVARWYADPAERFALCLCGAAV